MKLIIYHPQGNANVRASAIAFAEAELLKEFHTSVAAFPGSFLDVIGGMRFFSEIRRRRLDLSLKPFTHISPGVELGRLISIRAGFHKMIKRETGKFSVQAVTRSLDKKVSTILRKAVKNGVAAVYAYEDGATYSFREAKQQGIECFYDLPTGYWRAKLRILGLEKMRFPEWENTIHGLLDSPEKLIRKDEEIKMADRIFVASHFTATTLKDFPGTLPPIEIIPYGFPTVGPVREYNTRSPIRLLFVGNLSQQKGIADLFKAVEAFGKNVILTLVGQKINDNCAVLNKELAKHHWIPGLPHPKVLQVMRTHDVLVFPTLFDGYGLVISEAMSQGTPVIATYNSAGPDLIEHGKNGWLIEPGSISELEAVIAKLIDNPDLIKKTGIEARETARMRPWNIYQRELSESVRQHFYSMQEK